MRDRARATHLGVVQSISFNNDQSIGARQSFTGDAGNDETEMWFTTAQPNLLAEGAAAETDAA